MVDKLEAILATYQRGDVELALVLIKDHLRRDKDDGRGWEMLGMIQHALGRFQVAVSALERASLLVPLYPAARICLAHAYGRIGRKALSKDLLAGLIADESLSIPLLLQVASGLDAIDQPGLAMQACREASRRDPHQAQPYYDMGYYALRCGRPASVAESLARKAITLDPTNVCYRIGLASHLIKQSRNDEGYDLLKRFSNEEIRQIRCRCCLGRIIDLYESAGDYRRVVVCREHLLSLEMRDGASDCD